MSFSIYHIKTTYYQHDLSLLMFILITWWLYGSSSFFTVKLLFFISISIMSYLEGSVHSPCLRGGDLCSLSLRVKYLYVTGNSFTLDICLLSSFIYLFIQSLIYINMGSQIFPTSDNSILYFFVAQIVPALSIGISYIWFLCSFDRPA